MKNFLKFFFLKFIISFSFACNAMLDFLPNYNNPDMQAAMEQEAVYEEWLKKRFGENYTQKSMTQELRELYGVYLTKKEQKKLLDEHGITLGLLLKNTQLLIGFDAEQEITSNFVGRRATTQSWRKSNFGSVKIPNLKEGKSAGGTISRAARQSIAVLSDLFDRSEKNLEIGLYDLDDLSQRFNRSGSWQPELTGSFLQVLFKYWDDLAVESKAFVVRFSLFYRYELLKFHGPDLLIPFRDIDLASTRIEDLECCQNLEELSNLFVLLFLQETMNKVDSSRVVGKVKRNKKNNLTMVDYLDKDAMILDLSLDQGFAMTLKVFFYNIQKLYNHGKVAEKDVRYLLNDPFLSKIMNVFKDQNFNGGVLVGDLQEQLRYSFSTWDHITTLLHQDDLYSEDDLLSLYYLIKYYDWSKGDFEFLNRIHLRIEEIDDYWEKFDDTEKRLQKLSKSVIINQIEKINKKYNCDIEKILLDLDVIQDLMGSNNSKKVSITYEIIRVIMHEDLSSDREIYYFDDLDCRESADANFNYINENNRSSYSADEMLYDSSEDNLYYLSDGEISDDKRDCDLFKDLRVFFDIIQIANEIDEELGQMILSRPFRQQQKLLYYLNMIEVDFKSTTKKLYLDILCSYFDKHSETMPIKDELINLLSNVDCFEDVKSKNQPQLIYAYQDLFNNNLIDLFGEQEGIWLGSLIAENIDHKNVIVNQINQHLDNLNIERSLSSIKNRISERIFKNISGNVVPTKIALAYVFLQSKDAGLMWHVRQLLQNLVEPNYVLGLCDALDKDEYIYEELAQSNEWSIVNDFMSCFKTSRNGSKFIGDKDGFIEFIQGIKRSLSGKKYFTSIELQMLDIISHPFFKQLSKNISKGISKNSKNRIKKGKKTKNKKNNIRKTFQGYNTLCAMKKTLRCQAMDVLINYVIS